MVIEHNGFTLELYDSIKELPADRFQDYNRNVMLDAGIGGDLSAFEARLSTIDRILVKNPDGARKELENLRTAVRFIVEGTSPEMSAFVPLIRRIDGRILTSQDMTEEGVKRIVERLNQKRVPFWSIKNFLSLVKKKFALEFELVFPKMTDDPEVKEFYAKLKRRTALVLEGIRNTGEDLEEQVRIIDDFLLSKIQPREYSGPDGMEVQTVKSFESTCVLLQQYNASPDPRKMSTLAFYQALEIIKEQVRKRAKK